MVALAAGVTLFTAMTIPAEAGNRRWSTERWEQRNGWIRGQWVSVITTNNSVVVAADGGRAEFTTPAQRTRIRHRGWDTYRTYARGTARTSTGDTQSTWARGTTRNTTRTRTSSGNATFWNFSH